ncbi:MAG: HD domain-containing protein [Candidatus Lokiarchaeota archaeon]|nr:HD domain-containing protein [Candidatus Lokiarchaeota archaeon]
MNNKDIITKVRNFAYDKSSKDDVHGFQHVQRVLKTSSELGVNLNANLLVITISALLHDVGRGNAKENHAKISAEIAREFLIKNKFEIPIEDFENIIHCISTHSFSNDLEPMTLEAKILSDADKLDALGAIGLYRTIGFTIKNGGGIEQVITHLENKILRLKDKLHLDESKKIAEQRYNIISDFYTKIKEQIKIK